jgi:diacylglycerol O-acyltransferase / wax synthase
MDLTADAVRPEPSEWTPQPEPTGLHLALEALENVVLSPYEQVRAARAQTRAVRRMVGYALEVAGGLFSLGGLVRPTPVSSLNGPLGPHRRYAWATTSVSDIKRVRQALGGTFNDVVLASITNGFRELLLARDEDVERVVRTLVPVSVRPRDSAGKAVGDGTYENKVSAMFAELPVDIDDPALRLHVITEQMKDLKDSSQALAGEALTSMSGFAPPMLLALGMRLATRAAQHNVNTVTTNVPGPQFPLYAAGRRMIRAFPYVPLGGQIRLGIAIFSYDGEVNFGITGDYDSTPDIDVLAGGIEDGMTQMLKVCDQPAR